MTDMEKQIQYESVHGRNELIFILHTKLEFCFDFPYKRISRIHNRCQRQRWQNRMFKMFHIIATTH